MGSENGPEVKETLLHGHSQVFFPQRATLIVLSAAND